MPACPYCGEQPEFSVSPAVSLTAHIEDDHPQVPLMRMATDVVRLCGRA